MDSKIICPITQEKIIIGGMTCNGQIYEYDAITEWFRNSDKDPLTGLYLASIFVRKFDVNCDINLIQELVEDAKKSYSIWYRVGHELSNTIVQQYYEKKQIKKNYDFTKKEWLEYNSFLRKELSDIVTNTRERPQNTGTGFDFINFSGFLFLNKQWKLPQFIFNNLNDAQFISCKLSRTKFIGCTMNNVIFDNCEFRGEEVCFYKLTGTFIFKNCSIEYTNKWIMTSELTEIVKILKFRGLDDRAFKIIDDSIIVL